STGYMYELLEQMPSQWHRDKLSSPQDWERHLLADPARIPDIFCNDFFNAIARHARQEGTASAADKVMTKELQVLATLPRYLYSQAASWVGLSGSGAAFFAWLPLQQSRASLLNELARFPLPLDILAARPVQS
ncbi:MAG: hypothetical protein AAF975_04410, partial [Spirochaetota bacterium]